MDTVRSVDTLDTFVDILDTIVDIWETIVAILDTIVVTQDIIVDTVYRFWTFLTQLWTKCTKFWTFWTLLWTQCTEFWVFCLDTTLDNFWTCWTHLWTLMLLNLGHFGLKDYAKLWIVESLLTFVSNVQNLHQAELMWMYTIMDTDDRKFGNLGLVLY